MIFLLLGLDFRLFMAFAKLLDTMKQDIRVLQFH